MSDIRYMVLQVLLSSMDKTPFVTTENDYEKLDDAYNAALDDFNNGWGPSIGIVEVNMKTGVSKQIADKDDLYAVWKEEGRK